MEKLVSISDLTYEAHEAQRETEAFMPMVWDMNLPSHVDTEKIGVKASALRMIHRAGMVNGSYVVGYQGDVTEVAPNVAGVNPDGTAVAGKSVAIIKVDRSIGAYDDSFKNFIKSSLGETDLDATFGRVDLLCLLNKPELASAATELVQSEDITSEAAWAKVLDGAVRESMRKAAKRHLIGRDNPLSYYLLGGMMTGFLPGAVMATAVGPRPSPAGVLEFCVYGFAQASPFMARAGMTPEAKKKYPKRWSVVPFGFQPDRYLALNALTRIPGMVKSRK